MPSDTRTKPADAGRDSDGILELSAERPYNIDEESYDARYKRGIDAGQLRLQGEHFAQFARDYGLNTTGTMLELGCGTGRLTAMMLASGIFGKMLLTDGSKAFVRITKRNMATLEERGFGSETALDYACLVDTDFDRLPDGAYGTISMFGVLHHFLDWRAALRALHPKLAPGGTIFFSEPCYDFMLISGLLASIFSHVAAEKGLVLDDRDQRSLRAMRNAASLRCAHDLDRKAPQEDKYAFRIDDIAAAGKAMGYDVTWLPNGNFTDPRGERRQFRETALHRLSVVNNFSEGLMQHMAGLLDNTLDYLSEVGDTGAGPYFDCLYVLKKL